jgi:hypothetical protein
MVREDGSRLDFSSSLGPKYAAMGV